VGLPSADWCRDAQSPVVSEAIFWGGVVYAVGFGLFVKRRRVLDTPTAKALSAAIGRAELCGTAHGDPSERSIVTDTPCAYWEAELYRRVPNGKGGKSMKRIAMANARFGHFWLADASGRVPVLVEGAHWWLDRALKLRNRGGTQLSERARRWVFAASGCEWEDGTFKIVERRLDEGGAVYVLGTLSTVADVLRPAPQARNERPRSVPGAIAKGFFDMFFKAAPPGGAMGEAIARIRSGADAAEVAQARRELPAWLQSGERVAVWKGARRDPFLIANCAENRLAQRLARWGIGTMAFGTLLILMGVWKLFE
jgi:hypothetical protein